MKYANSVAWGLILTACLTTGGQSTRLVAQTPSKELAEQLLALPPRPPRPALPPSQLPLELLPNERIAFLGNSLAERMNLFGHFESRLHTRFPDKKLVIRNFGRPAEEVGRQQRSADYTALDDPLLAFGADTFFCFFGFNESFAGEAGLEQFKADYHQYLDQMTRNYPRDDAGNSPRFVLVSPIAFESSGDPLLPDADAINRQLFRYSQAIAEVARQRDLAFVDIFDSSASPFHRAMIALPRMRLDLMPGRNDGPPNDGPLNDGPLNDGPLYDGPLNDGPLNDGPLNDGLTLTINGCHLNEQGDHLVAFLLDVTLFGTAPAADFGSDGFERLRAAVNDKSWVHQQDYRMLNGWYVYGGRRTWDTETFPREYLKIRKMADVRDRYIWDIAQGKPVPQKPDDSETGELTVPATRFGEPAQKYSEADELRYLTPEEFQEATTVPSGFAVELFADATMFPELANPVQLNFDNRGRLWVACMPTYPQWKPGDDRPNDRLIILEDTDQDGKADKCTVFYDRLHCPTGFEFWNGGVLVVDQPRLLWLKDTTGDDIADQIVHLMDGWATDDTHHTASAFEWSHGGYLHMLEGIATSTTLETPWGPHISQGTGGAYVLNPRTLKISQFALPGQYNMWCYVFDEWGQGIVGDGTTANHAWDTPLSGAQFRGRSGLNMVFENEGMRRALGCEFLVSRHFPDDVQRQFTYACVINMTGMPRFKIWDDGGGFSGARLKHADDTPDDLIRSTDKHFRPADPQIGPDGALWFGDWANALIGHMQYSQRDPNRDHQRGRIYRLVYPERPLLEPATQYDKPVGELLEQLRAYEWRTRYRARRELRDRPTSDVVAAVQDWLSSLDPSDSDYERLRCEALWVLQAHKQLDADLLRQVLTGAEAFQARAAAVRILADERDALPDALETLIAASRDDHPRVRTEAARGLSFYADMEATRALIRMGEFPEDYWCDYTIQHALGANENVWRGEYLTGKLVAPDSRAADLVAKLLSASRSGAAALPFLQTLLSQDPKPAEERQKAMTALAELRGNVNRGREVFVRTCTSCHRVGNGDGREFGPNLAGVAKRLTGVKVVESVIDPNAEVDPKYRSTLIATADGLLITGLVVSEDDEFVEIFDGEETRRIAVDDIEDRVVQQQSSMPEGSATTLSPAEFVDLIAYVKAQTQDVSP